MPAREQHLPLAERLLELALAQGATEAEVVILATDAALTRFASSEIHQNVAETNVAANLRFVDGRRSGVASGNRLDEAGLRELAATAARIARVQPEQPDPVALPDPSAPNELLRAWSERTAQATPEARASAVGAVIAAAEDAGVMAFGSFATSSDGLAVANTRGVRAEQLTSRARLVTICMGPDGEAGYAEALAVDLDRIDPEAIGREAASRAVHSRGPVSLAPGAYPVVLEPYAVVDLLDWIGGLGFSALAVEEGRSFYAPGRRIASELVSTWDDATDPDGTPSAIDEEGATKRRVSLIDRGVCAELVYDAATAARAGRPSTGHGFLAPNPYGPAPSNQFMAPGAASREELIAGLDHGLLITRFNYTNAVHPKRAIVTGMTRDGSFLVEHGEIVGPVRNLRFTQSYLEALAAVEAVGRERRLLAGELGTCVVPGLRIGSWDFTGSSEL
ncbi:MAG: TldD/PmbA family protein [Candidatus Limnocylindrales bacterium]